MAWVPVYDVRIGDDSDIPKVDAEIDGLETSEEGSISKVTVWDTNVEMLLIERRIYEDNC